MQRLALMHYSCEMVQAPVNLNSSVTRTRHPAQLQRAHTCTHRQQMDRTNKHTQLIKTYTPAAYIGYYLKLNSIIVECFLFLLVLQQQHSPPITICLCIHLTCDVVIVRLNGRWKQGIHLRILIKLTGIFVNVSVVFCLQRTSECEILHNSHWLC